MWQDPRTGMFVVTRYEDIKSILANPELFTNAVGSAAGMTEKAVKPTDPEEAAKAEQAAQEERVLARLYQDEGWPPVATLDALDPPVHMELRRMFDHAFRPGRVKQLNPYVESLTNTLFDAFIDDGECEWVKAVAIPLPLYVIGRQMGVPEQDMPRIKAWTDAWVQRLGLMQTFEERMWSARQEIEAQHYFQPIFERFREHAGHPVERPRQQRDPRMGPPADRRRTALGDDGQPVRRRLRDDHQHVQRRRAHVDRAARRVDDAEVRPRAVPADVRRGGGPPRGTGAGTAPRGSRPTPSCTASPCRRARW